MLRAHNSFKTNFWSIIYSFIFAKVDANLENPFFYADLFDTFVSIESSFWEQVWQVFIRFFFSMQNYIEDFVLFKAGLSGMETRKQLLV